MEQVQDKAPENCIKIHHITISNISNAYLILSASLFFFFSEWLVFKYNQMLCSYIKTDKHQLFWLFSFANQSFVSLSIYVSKFTYWDANNVLSFPLFRFNSSKKIQGLIRHIYYSLPSTTAASREKKKIHVFLLIIFSRERQHLFCKTLHLPPGRTLAHRWHHANRYNIGRNVTPGINILYKP